MKYRYNSILGHKVSVDKNILIEGTINGMQKQFPKIPENIWKVILSLDPEVKGNQCGVTTRFLAQLTLNKAKQDNGFDNCEEYLLNVIKPAIAMLQEKGAIKQLGKLNVSDPMIDTKLINLAQTLENKKEANKFAREVSVINKSLELGAQEIYNSNRYLVLIPWTEESSNVFRDGEGNNTLCVWCTAWSGDNRWAYYMKSMHPLKIVFDKETGKLYQYCGSSDSWAGFRDQHNKKVNINEVIQDEACKNIILNDDAEMYAESAETVMNKFENKLSTTDKIVLKKYIFGNKKITLDGNNVENYEAYAVAIALHGPENVSGITLDEAEHLINNHEVFVYSEASDNEELGDFISEYIDELIDTLNVEEVIEQLSNVGFSDDALNYSFFDSTAYGDSMYDTIYDMENEDIEHEFKTVEDKIDHIKTYLNNNASVVDLCKIFNENSYIGKKSKETIGKMAEELRHVNDLNFNVHEFSYAVCLKYGKLSFEDFDVSKLEAKMDEEGGEGTFIDTLNDVCLQIVMDSMSYEDIFNRYCDIYGTDNALQTMLYDGSLNTNAVANYILETNGGELCMEDKGFKMIPVTLTNSGEEFKVYINARLSNDENTDDDINEAIDYLMGV